MLVPIFIEARTSAILFVKVQWFTVEEDIDSIAFVGRCACSNSFIDTFSLIHELKGDSARVWNEVEATLTLSQEGHHVDDLRVVSGVDQVFQTRPFLISYYTCDDLLHQVEWLPENARAHKVACIIVPVVCEPCSLELICDIPLFSSEVFIFLHDTFEAFSHSCVSEDLETVEVIVDLLFF